MIFVSRVLNVLLIGFVLFACARTLSTLNQYLDSREPTFEETVVLEKGRRFVPFSVATLTVRFPSGLTRTLEVLPEAAQAMRVGSEVQVAHSAGLFGREWLQEGTFYRELQGTIRVTKWFYLGILLMLTGILYYQLKVVLKSGKSALRVLPLGLVASLGLFYVLP